MSSKGIINKKEIRVFGLRRSGHHAIINWIFSQEKGKVCFLNNIFPRKSPFLHKDNFRVKNIKNFNRVEEGKGKFTKKDCLIYNFEDQSLEDVFRRTNEKNRKSWVGKSLKRYDLIVLRDPFNFIASRMLKTKLNTYYFRIPVLSKVPWLKKYTIYPSRSLVIKPIWRVAKRFRFGFEHEIGPWYSMDKGAKLWKVYAKEFLNIKNRLGKDKIPINYNDWFSNKAYRKAIAKKLGLKFTDKGVNEVSSNGGGSSVDGVKFGKSAHKMQVLTRWKRCVRSKAYRDIFKDKEIVELSNRIFGEIPGTEKLTK